MQVKTFKKKTLIDVRKYYSDGLGAIKPTKKGAPSCVNPYCAGISLQVEEWEQLKQNIETIDQAVKLLKS